MLRLRLSMELRLFLIDKMILALGSHMLVKVLVENTRRICVQSVFAKVVPFDVRDS